MGGGIVTSPAIRGVAFPHQDAIAAVGNFNRCHSLSQVQVVIRMNTEDTNTVIDCDIHGLDT